MEDVLIPLIAITVMFLGLPWLVFHYVTKWKQAKTLTVGDEQLLDGLHELARRLDDRLCTIERIMNAENPEWRQTCLPEAGTPLSDDALSAELPRTRARRGEKA
ncbi:MAG TPA: envelope stress response membrane protein PspB [Sphingomicrobium sp.]|nr:envelope stress response membrane protein PspB [Sphingomicrobium sp.]